MQKMQYNLIYRKFSMLNRSYLKRRNVKLEFDYERKSKFKTGRKDTCKTKETLAEL